MAVQRQFNFLGQGRVDVPHLRLLESAVCGDFDALAGYVISGKQPLVVTGFKVDPSTVGAQYTSLKVIVANSALLHYGASESGTIFTVPATQTPETLTTTNTNVVGSFVTGADNFIGVDLVRKADNTTTDSVAFLNSDTEAESSRPAALGRVMKYRFVISTRSFSSAPNVCPVAIVTLDTNGFVTKITDARRLMFRLGSGGDVPNPSNRFAFSQRKDSPYFTTSSATDPFSGGDKDISSLKSWQDSVMTRLWEVGGGEYWYSATAAWDVIMVRTGATFTNGDYFTWDGTYLQWKGLKFLFANSTGTINEIADNTANVLTGQMADGDAIYVDLDRTQNHTTGGGNQLSIASGNVGRTSLALVGSGVNPGNRYVVAWRIGSNVYTRGSPFAVGFPIAPAGVATNTTGAPATGSLGGVAISAPVTTAAGAFTSSYPVALGYQEKDAASGVASFDAAFRALVNGITRRTAGILTLGDQANDTSVAIGKTGANTNIVGTMSVTQLLSLAAGLDSTAGALTIAGTTASAVNISKAGVLTTIKGNFEVDGTSSYLNDIALNGHNITGGGSITGTSLSAGAGAISGGAISGTSLSAGAGSITGGPITGTTVHATTSIDTPAIDNSGGNLALGRSSAGPTVPRTTGSLSSVYGQMYRQNRCIAYTRVRIKKSGGVGAQISQTGDSFGISSVAVGVDVTVNFLATYNIQTGYSVVVTQVASNGTSADGLFNDTSFAGGFNPAFVVPQVYSITSSSFNIALWALGTDPNGCSISGKLNLSNAFTCGLDYSIAVFADQSG